MPIQVDTGRPGRVRLHEGDRSVSGRDPGIKGSQSNRESAGPSSSDAGSALSQSVSWSDCSLRTTIAHAASVAYCQLAQDRVALLSADHREYAHGEGPV